MNLFSLCQADTELKRVASTRGGEYAGPCPWCGGRDRFRVWPEIGRYWCRVCERKGDVIQYLRDRHGMSFQEACEALGRPLDPRPIFTSRCGRNTPQRAFTALRRPVSARAWPAKALAQEQTPRTFVLPSEVWQARARELVAYAVRQLDTATLAYLHSRGLQSETIKVAGLGRWPLDWYQRRRAWGLPEKIISGRTRDLWLPAGIVIPCFRDGQIVRIRIRRFGGEPKYYIVPGSFTGPMTWDLDRPIVVVVESEFDGILLAQELAGMTGVVALGSAQGKLDQATDQVLRQAALLLIALDADEAGMWASWKWWLEQYPNARRWPPLYGKDPGEMHQNGINLAEWIEAGIREYLLF